MRRTAPVTYGIVAVTLVVFALQLLPGLNVTQTLLYSPIFSLPGNFFEPWRMLTTAFVHSTGFLLHVGLNMYMLWILGAVLEPMLGGGRFLTLYLLSAWGGSVAVLWMANPLTQVVGASGAIFGLMGALVAIQRSLGSSATQLYVLLGLNFAVGFLPGTNISWQAHLGGLVTGFAVGWIYAKWRAPNLRTQQMVMVAVVIGALALLSARFFFQLG